MDDDAISRHFSPVLADGWMNSRWGPDDQRGNGNLMTPQKVLEAVGLIKTGEIVSLGMPYDARMPLAPGRAYALRMPGGPTGGPYRDKSRTIWNDEFIATEIGQVGTQMDALGHLGCMCGALGDKTKMLFYNGNRLADMWSPHGLRKLGIENAPPFFTRGVLFDVQGLKGRVPDVGEEIKLSDLKACLARHGHHAPTVDVGHLQVRDLGHPQACAVGDAERGLVLEARAAWRRRATSSWLRTTGALRGLVTVLRGRTRSGFSSVTVKKNRSAAMAALIVPGQACCCAICS